MNKELALKVLDAILLSSKRKIKIETLKKFFHGLNLDELINEANLRYQNLGFFIYQNKKEKIRCRHKICN
jgi:chromosome segregation and condensation protein ScpB